MIDSRMWDPQWEYRTQWRALHNVLAVGLGDPDKAATVASLESFSWGKGVAPQVRLMEFVDVAVDQVYERLNKLFKAFQSSFR